jgi:hypothetical protein
MAEICVVNKGEIQIIVWGNVHNTYWGESELGEGKGENTLLLFEGLGIVISSQMNTKPGLETSNSLGS